MFKYAILLLSILVSSSSFSNAAEWKEVTCAGYYNHHLQGVCVSGSELYWSFTTKLVKTDNSGKVIKAIDVENHHGDLCASAGKIYVAVNLGRFNQPAGQADSWIFVYDADTLTELSRHEVQEVVHGAGGIEQFENRFFVVGGLPKDHLQNYVYEYNSRFEFIKQHVVDSGYTLLGIQTVARSRDGLWYFGCYGNTLLVTDDQFRLKSQHKYDCALGIQPVEEGLFLSAWGKTDPQLGCLGKVRLAVKDELHGLKLISAKPDEK